MLKKFFGILIGFIVLLIILVFVLEYRSTNSVRVKVEDNIEYKTKIKNINIVSDSIDSLKNKLKRDEITINNLDDSATVELFLELVRGD